jgi:hypothetical protein
VSRPIAKLIAALALNAVTASAVVAQVRVGADSARRLDRFGRDLAYGTAEGAAFAGVDQWRDDPAQWHRNWPGYGQRLASNLGEFYIQEGTTEGLAAIINRPLDYQPCNCRRMGDRAGWAIRGALVDYLPNGRTALAIPRIAGAYVGSLAQAQWRPANGGDRTRVALVNGTTSLLLGAAINLYDEFKPWSANNRCRRSGGSRCSRAR